jgi:predicted nucleic acid-binding protein
MKAYWDASALIQATSDLTLRSRLRADGGITRPHSLAEVFSNLTKGGNLAIRVDADQAADLIDNLSGDLEFVDLSAGEMRKAFKQAKRRGVRGGRVHDFMHAVAAEKAGVQELLTLDQNDFIDLLDSVKPVYALKS